MRKDFADVVVEIDSGERLLEELRAVLDQAGPWQRREDLLLWPVEYTMGTTG